MPVLDPKVVRKLLTRYASLRIGQAERPTPAAARELAEVTRGLCAMTGTTDVREAIARADALLIRTRGTGEQSGLPLAG
ncbi:DUF5133 domain-containing protein [Streptomyces sp. NPDC001508]|uniref:DUF5133 domain-containing protein n=1 Tax=Streptomyces sp. NPDC001508 TaxID=3154656 RepID=UPI003331E496